MKKLFLIVAFFIGVASNAQVKVLGAVVPNNPADTYGTHYDSLGIGGYMTVTTIAERNAIPAARRKFGMIVSVKEPPTTDSIFKLVGDLSNTGWIPFLSGTGISDSPRLDSTQFEPYGGGWGVRIRDELFSSLDTTFVRGDYRVYEFRDGSKDSSLIGSTKMNGLFDVVDDTVRFYQGTTTRDLVIKQDTSYYTSPLSITTPDANTLRFVYVNDTTDVLLNTVPEWGQITGTLSNQTDVYDSIRARIFKNDSTAATGFTTIGKSRKDSALMRTLITAASFSNSAAVATALSDETGTGSMVFATSPTLVNPSISGGILTTGSTPSIAAGTGAGTGPTISISGTDIAGKISITPGTTPAANGIVGTITFSATLASVPKAVMLTAGNVNGGTAYIRVFADDATLSTTSWVLKNTGTALNASTPYIWFYYIIR